MLNVLGNFLRHNIAKGMFGADVVVVVVVIAV